MTQNFVLRHYYVLLRVYDPPQNVLMSDLHIFASGISTALG